jgi:hypothetical protein
MRSHGTMIASDIQPRTRAPAVSEQNCSLFCWLWLADDPVSSWFIVIRDVSTLRRAKSNNSGRPVPFGSIQGEAPGKPSRGAAISLKFISRG